MVARLAIAHSDCIAESGFCCRFQTRLARPSYPAISKSLCVRVIEVGLSGLCGTLSAFFRRQLSPLGVNRLNRLRYSLFRRLLAPALPRQHFCEGEMSQEQS